MKKIIHSISSLFVLRWITLIFLKIFHIIDRIISHLKYNALVKKTSNSVCHWSVEIKYGQNISVGNDTSIGPNCCLGAKGGIEIGSFCRISRGVIVETAGLNLKAKQPYPHTSKPIKIGNGVWIASNAIILGGVIIGDNSIIGAGVVITKNVAEGSVVVGNGNRIINSN